MTLKDLIAALDAAELSVRVEGDTLRIGGRAERLTPDLRAALVRWKPQLIAALTAPAKAPAIRLEPDPNRRYEPFALTDIQQAYSVGRRRYMALGGVSTHYYSELDCEALDLSRLEAALNRLIVRHDMLRAVINDEHQQVLPEVPAYRVAEEDLSRLHPSRRDARLTEIRDQLSHEVRPLDVWPLFEVRASRLDDRVVRLHLSIDLMIADFLSLSNLAQEWRGLYDHPERSAEPAALSFRDCVLAQRTSPGQARARRYWQARLDQLPPAPALPTVAGDPDPRFERLEARLDAQRWARLRARARVLGATPSSLVMTAFSEVLRRWSGQDRFTLTLTQFGRPSPDPEVMSIVGDFTAALLVAVDLSAATFAERVRATHLQVLADVEHGDYSGVRVARDLMRHTGDAARSSFPVVFTSALALGDREGPLDGFEVFGQEVYGISQTPQVALDHVVAERGGELRLRWDYRAKLFPKGLVAEMFEAYQVLLETLSDDACDLAADLRARPSGLDLAERARANTTARSLPGGRLERLFADQAVLTPDAPAVISEAGTVSYRALLDRAGAVAEALAENGVRPGDLVAIHMPAGVDEIAAVLGVLLCGGAYVPLSMAWPAQRRQEVMEQAGISVLLTPANWPRDTVARRLAPPPERPGYVPPEDAFAADEDALAYVIFTSGSSGRPKGVAVTHRAAVNTIQDLNDRLGVSASDRVLALSQLSFDLSVYDIFGLLAVGGAIVTVTEDGHGRRNPRHWCDLIALGGVTVWNSVPALMQMLVEYLDGETPGSLEALRTVMLSGDWIPVGLPCRVRRWAPSAAILGLGGATEAAIWSIAHRIDGPVTTRSVPYGKPLANQTWRVLATDMTDSPRHVPGDLYIGGAGLALGYWRDEAKTAAAFIHHPKTGERLYRTGDLGRYVEDGVIEFLGRRDGQVKIGGFRIELEEIEARLQEHPDVGSCAVVVLHGRELGAMVTGRAVEPPGSETLRRWLAARLPQYMLPQRFQASAELPKSANGKIDRAAVAALIAAAPESAAAPAPGVSRLEAEILGLLATEVGAPLSPTMNFFEQGVDSLVLVRLHRQLEARLGRTIDPTTLFDHPSPRLLAASLVAVEDEASKAIDDVDDLRRQRAARGARRRVIHEGEAR